MTSIREISGHNVVLEINSPGNALINALAAACYNWMFTPSNDLPSKVVAILELRFKMISRTKCVAPTALANEDLGPYLPIDPARRA
jgi:hypothetical protein